jgi:hypothetical protein
MCSGGRDILDPKGLEAFHRLHHRTQHALCDIWQLLWGQGAAAWEACIKQSFAAGMSLNLEEATAKHRVIMTQKQQVGTS